MKASPIHVKTRHRDRSLLLGLGLALGLHSQAQAATDQPLCQALARLQRTIAEQRDRGLSLSDAQRAMRVAIEQAPELLVLQNALLDSVRRTYQLGLSPDMTEITAYGVCIEALRKD